MVGTIALVEHGGNSPPVSLSDAPAQELMIHPAKLAGQLRCAALGTDRAGGAPAARLMALSPLRSGYRARPFGTVLDSRPPNGYARVPEFPREIRRFQPFQALRESSWPVRALPLA